MAILKNTTFGNVVLPDGSTAERPGSPTNGMLRYNTSQGLLEFYNGGWRPVTGVAKGTIGSGGNEIRWAGSHGSRANGGIVHMFTSTGGHTFVPTFTGTVEVLIVGGGASGGSHWGGGGGGGAMIYNRSYPVSAGSSYPITVGGGGSAPSYPNRGNNGGNSIFNGVTAVGGGAGGSWDGNNALPGGSGGGGATGSAQGSRFRYEGGLGNYSGQGYPGGSGVRYNQ